MPTRPRRRCSGARCSTSRRASFPNVSRTFVPVGCQHCADPPCMHVCPTTATRQRADGIVTIDYDICIGCAYCDVACPYQARFMVHEPRLRLRPGAMQNEIEREDDRAPRRRAEMHLLLRPHRFRPRERPDARAAIRARRRPASTPASPTPCIFGDVDDPDSNVVHSCCASSKHFRMHEEIGTEPGFYYLYGKREPADAAAGRADPRSQAEAGQDPHPRRRALASEALGLEGGGEFPVRRRRHRPVRRSPAVAGARRPSCPGLAALAIVAIGLTLLMFKIGRPFRFIYVLRQPQRSWMSREAWVAGAVLSARAARHCGSTSRCALLAAARRSPSLSCSARA